ncbi:hypothetical protein BpHYR1_028554 [Brachionus plicatilis]|uniref:Transposase domain-containing protein n=1 Tax=Brachionus plicatilis TaxID=10195 RepID=A0A3M7S0Q9_BRAPC|nr:hypothetical protein BpHYR1_028554 [Brachionus plicatilis]
MIILNCQAKKNFISSCLIYEWICILDLKQEIIHEIIIHAWISAITRHCDVALRIRSQFWLYKCNKMPYKNRFAYLRDKNCKVPKSTLSKKKESQSKQTNNSIRQSETQILLAEQNEAGELNFSEAMITNETDLEENTLNSCSIVNKVYPPFSNDIKVTMGLLAMFYSSKFTKAAFSVVIELLKAFQLITNLEIGKFKSFDSCANFLVKFTNDSIDFKRRIYCKKCQKHFLSEAFKKTRYCFYCHNRITMIYEIDIIPQIKRILSKGQYFTLTLNSDGIKLSDKSNMSIWPVILIINELPLETRFLIENTIIAGVILSDGTPNLDIVLKIVQKQLVNLENGIKLNDSYYTKFFLIASVFDKPARSKATNMVSSIGFYSCLRCTQKGETFYTQSGHFHIFPLIKFNPFGPLRNELSYEHDLFSAKNKGLAVNGIKKESSLSDLKYYHPILSVNVDSMHSVYHGIIKEFFRYWFEKPSELSSILKKQINVLNSRLMSIRPPSYVPSAPRPLHEYHNWKAHEFMIFIFYYAPIIFYQVKLKNFTSSFHELLHFSDLTLDFGPLNVTCCFQYEEINRKIINLIHGFDLVCEEFIQKFSTIQIFSALKVNILEEKLSKDINENFLKSSNSKFKKKQDLMIQQLKINQENTVGSFSEQEVENVSKFFGQKFLFLKYKIKLQWLIDKKFSVLTENSIVEGSLDLDLELGAVYDFQFGKDVLKAELKMIDNEIECKNQLKILTDYEICPDKKRKLNSEYDLKEITKISLKRMLKELNTIKRGLRNSKLFYPKKTNKSMN